MSHPNIVYSLDTILNARNLIFYFTHFVMNTYTLKKNNHTKRPHPYIKYLQSALIQLDQNPSYDSEVAVWLDNNNLLQIFAYIHPEEEAWMYRFCQLLNKKEFAPLISSIEIKGPDQGIDETRLYDFTTLLNKPEIVFSNLIEFEVEQTLSIHKNIIMITNDDFYEENGAGGKILDKMPNLLSLTLPSAPSPCFFDREFHPIQHLNIQAGYDHHGFLSHLSKAKCFPNLKSLEWTNGPGMALTSHAPQSHIEQVKKSKTIQLIEFKINQLFIELPF